MTIWLPDLAKRSGPLYMAIADAVGADTTDGHLPAGTRLPTHRELAGRLGVTVGTVSRGYAEAIRRGLLSGEVGRGTFVRRRFPEPLPPMQGDDPSIVDLSLNYPPALPGEPPALRATLRALAARPDLAALMAYQPTAGALPHRAAGAQWIRRTGLAPRPEQVLVTNGSQHGLTILFGTLLRPGDLLLTENLTYPGVKAVANLLHLRLEGLPMDGHGIKPEAFEAACRGGTAKALYCIPTIQNPTTVVMPQERRREIAAMADAHGVAIVEDDIHGSLPPEPARPLSAYAPDNCYYLASTSKSLAPGLRIGFLMAPERMVERLAAGIRASTWVAAPLMAEIAATWIQDGTADAILERKREEAAARVSLARTLLGGLEFQAHPFGYHLWLQLPEPWRSDAFVAQARARGVAVTAAEAFVVGRGSAPHAVRVGLGAARSRTELEKGLRLLVEVLAGSPEASSSIL